VELSYWPGVIDDIKALPTIDLQKKAAALLLKVADGTIVGRELDYHVETGDLRDCHKLYFGESGAATKPAYRLVYRVLPDAVEAVTMEAVAIGRRQNSEAYVTAAQRLGRMPVRDQSPALQQQSPVQTNPPSPTTTGTTPPARVSAAGERPGSRLHDAVRAAAAGGGDQDELLQRWKNRRTASTRPDTPTTPPGPVLNDDARRREETRHPAERHHGPHL